MKLTDYIKEKLICILLMLLFITSIFTMGYAFKASLEYQIALAVLVVLFSGVLFFFDYGKRNRFYKEYFSTLEKLDQKYLITEMELEADFPEGKLLLSSLYEIDKSMKEHLNRFEISMQEFKEYVELWIHEIKIPISALSLMNYNENIDLKKQKAQIDKLSYYVDQILFYARADSAEKDFVLKECDLEQVINKVLKEQKDLLIGNHVAIEKKNVSARVTTDAKWLEFLIGQIVNNSVKYRDEKKQSNIAFMVETSSGFKNNITKLIIEDNGIGVSEMDLPRVFDKTFTGENGRKGSVSTGMGLYICKKLCKKLGHSISMESKQGECTRVEISFGDETFVNM